ncbi:MAG: carboxypeptidase regulatory-like domain-containing protein [Caldilineales bacterium]|nr:carboxypeptidase regulatory-like domain-containing protein [Caldilineales bacterium]
MSHKRMLRWSNGFRILNLAIILAMVVSLIPWQITLPGPLPDLGPETASAHNLQTRMIYMFFDPEAQACLDARIEGASLPAGCAPLPGGWQVGDPLLQVGDELGVIIKVVPRDGTTTGVGGHIDFYIPNGVQVVDVAYVVPDGAGNYLRVAMKGQSPIAIGAGSISAKTTAQLVGLNDIYTSAASGLSSTAVNPATGLHLGTIAGLYGDTGIFYATHPDTAYGSWQRFTGDPVTYCGSTAFGPPKTGKTIINNSGDVVVPCNKWDAGQLMAWSAKGGTYGQSAPIVDYADGRGNAPWGFANGVAGPQSGYAWEFDWNQWHASAKTAADMRAAMAPTKIGPWERIQYPGSRISYDQPGLLSSVIGYANINAGNLGIPATALPPTVSQTDATSPKVIRWAVGQLTAYRPEYAWVKVRVEDAAAGITNASGCPDLRGDTFGGDAGGTDNGKDHLWRYYEPTEVKMNMCAAAGKPATAEIVKSGTVFQYPVKVYNLQNFPLTNVVVRDILGSGLTFLSSVPAQSSGPNPLVWNVGTLLPGQKFEALVTVRAGSSGYLDNCIEMSSNELPTQNACDSTISGSYPYLAPSKTARSTGVAAGDTVIYDVLVKNTGTGPTGNPVTIREFLPSGFTYDASYPPVVTVNGARVTPTVNATNPNQPIFTIPAAIQGGQQLTLAFRAHVSPTAEPGLYCNTYSVTQNGVPITTGSEACVSVAGGKIGDTVWRDWDGDGVQDAGEEGIAGVTVKLYESDGTTLLATATTDANGNYHFPGLTEGTYVVEVNNGAALLGTAQTGDPDSACPGAGCDNRHTVVLATDQQYLTADFGYQPGGPGAQGDVDNKGDIGDLVFEDVGNDGSFTPGYDTGIPGVTVWLYEDANGDGIINPATDALVRTTTTNASGLYSFTFLGEGYHYIVKVDKTDPDIQTYFNTTYGGTPPYQLSTPETTASPNLTGADLDNDFGFWRVAPGSIGDQVFIDNNGNGVYDAGDAPLAGVTVTLYRDGELFRTTVSGPDGTYLFANLGPGDYTVVVDTNDPDIPAGYFASITRYDKTLAAGEDYLTADFPFAPLIAKSVDKSVANPNDVLNYSITLNYGGNELLSDVVVRDYIPLGTTFSSVSAGGVITSYQSTAGKPGLNPGAGGYADAVFDESFVTNSENAINEPDGQVATINRDSGNYLTLDLGKSVSNGTVLTVRMAEGGSGGNSPSAQVDGSTDGTTFEGLATYSSLPSSLANYNYTVSHSSGSIRYLRIRVAGGSGNRAILVDAVTMPSSPLDPATETSLAATPIVTALGAPVTVVMTVTASYAVTNVTPSALQVVGGGAAISGPTPASRNLAANTPATFTWTVVPSKVGEYSFLASALSALGIEFVEATSNNILVTPEGQDTYVQWNLGSTAPGSTGIAALNKFLYAFRGADTTAFWAYNTASSLWNNPTDPTDTSLSVSIGGALTNDGNRYIYALRGRDTRTFMRYDPLTGATGTWDVAAVADLPATTDRAVREGGALVYLNGYVYALIGRDSRQFWRYSVTGNSWTRMADAPQVIKAGGALTTGGGFIYASQGKEKKKGFWRYNPATNTWTTLASPKDAFGNGSGLVYANGAVYATRGDGQATFFRYNIAANTWTALASAPGNIAEGGALAFNGTYINALRGKSNTFYRYNLATNAWTTLATTPANTGHGGALTFLAYGSVSRTTASVSRSLVTGVSQVALRMTVTSDTAINNVTANAPTYTATGGATASFSAATLISPDNHISGAGAPVIYQWTATITPGTTPGTVIFTTSSVLNGQPGATATANSVLVVPILTFQTTVDSPNPPSVIYNTALLNEVGGALGNVPSNTTETYTGAIPASIGDRVWADGDGDGVQDTGEPGLAGVEICVYQSDGTTLVGCDTSDAFGNYRVSSLDAGDYVVRTNPATYPAGYFPTTATSLSVTLTAGQQYDAADFGLKAPATGSIGDLVWLDADEDGALDAGENGLPGITVTLEITVAGAWIPVATTTTDASGLYTFTGLIAGDYRVTVDPTSPVVSPYASGSFSLGDVMAPTYDLDGIGTPHEAVVTLPTDSSVVDTVDFGYNWSGSIGDFVWWDDNANGLQDETPPVGISNARVQLYFDANNDGVFRPLDGDFEIMRVFTDANGYYLFQNLPPGNYIVDVYEDSITTDGVRDVVPTTADNIVVTLVPGNMNVDTADFGYYRGARVAGSVFHDDDRNGIREPGENGLAGITVTLSGADMFSNTVFLTTTTDAAGHFVFVAPEGDYTLTYDTVATATAGYPDATTVTSFIFHASPGEDWYENTVFNFGVDYGGKIGDTVWNDADGDGVQDAGEPGLAGVTVNLYASNGATWLAAAVTDANGKYLFEGLADGDYVVKIDPVTLPINFGQAYDNFGPLDDTGVATVSGGGAVLDVDFGYRYAPVGGAALYTLSGRIYDDLNDNGNDDGEPGFAGVDVTVVCTLLGAVTVQTDSNGDWAVAGNADENDLPRSDYVANETPSTPITVTADVSDLDFGYVLQPGSVSGRICEGSGSGQCDPGDPGVAGITVTLTYAGDDGILGTGDDAVITTTTSITGFYTFTGLEPGLYEIGKSNPSGYDSLADADGGNPDSITKMGSVFALGVGEDAVDRDFELEAQTGLIGDLVWHDLDGDGIQDGSEPGLAGVVVNLLDSGGGFVISTTTDANGVYTFTAPPGDYIVEFEPPTGYEITRQDEGVDDAVDSDADPVTGRTGVITLTAGAVIADVDAGLYQPVTIGDFIFLDPNANAIQDPGETTGVPNVPITLTNLATGAIYNTTSNGSGAYTFTVPPGSYAVSTPAALPGLVRTSPSPATVTLSSGQSDLTLDRLHLAHRGDAGQFQRGDNGRRRDPALEHKRRARSGGLHRLAGRGRNRALPSRLRADPRGKRAGRRQLHLDRRRRRRGRVLVQAAKPARWRVLRPDPDA